MIRSLAIGVAIAVTTPAHSAVPTLADQAVLQQLADRMDHAWTVADADANADLFAADATARFGEDPLGAGRREIRRQFQLFFRDRPADLRHVTKIERMEQLAPNLIMWDAEVRVERRQGAHDWTTLTRIRNVTLVARRPEGWRIQAVRAFPIR
jgi:uncharacterized protein (TIGR02246 family)